MWLVALMFLVPAIHETHFFFGHRLLHQGALYKWIRSIHHNFINPSPWSSLSMHPIESAFFFSQVLWHLVIPSNPIVALFQINQAGYGAINGHIGFDTLELTDEKAMNTEAYAHYLHHK